jgi:hypothetical protein
MSVPSADITWVSGDACCVCLVAMPCRHLAPGKVIAKSGRRELNPY